MKSVNKRVRNPEHIDSGTSRLLLAPAEGALSFNGQSASTHYSITQTRAFISCIVDKIQSFSLRLQQMQAEGEIRNNLVRSTFGVLGRLMKLIIKFHLLSWT